VAAPQPTGTVLSETEFRQRERENVLLALHKTGWKIHGAGGAAEILGLKPTTLISRVKKLGLTKPAKVTAKCQQRL
jgi:transcriptional regulator with GAF, ATPase, and Fis domain